MQTKASYALTSEENFCVEKIKLSRLWQVNLGHEILHETLLIEILINSFQQ